MKWISLLLLVMLLPVSGEPDELGEVALGFMEKVRAGQVDLEPGVDTALAPETGEGKREQIARS
ncbi:MAG: hypothetical protein ACO3RV_06695, partial [Luteolibacter sp.]